MRVNKIVIAVTMAFLSACSSTEEKDAGLKGSQTGVIDASISGYDETDTGFKSNTPLYDPLVQGVDNNSSSTESISATDRGNIETSSTITGNASPTSSDDLIYPESKDTVYFSYDSSRVRAEFIPIIETFSQQLLANPEQIVILEGHADERGTREYNIALGEERAKAVAKMIIAKGVFSGQLEIVSYGEEKPASNRHDEAGWQLNRRVKLIYQRTSK